MTEKLKIYKNYSSRLYPRKLEECEQWKLPMTETSIEIVLKYGQHVTYMRCSAQFGTIGTI